MAHYVYIMQANRYVKIGVSANPERRRTTMQTGNPNVISIVAVIPFDSRAQAFEEEYRLHYAMRNYHFQGEWFSAKCLKLLKKFRKTDYKIVGKRKFNKKGWQRNNSNRHKAAAGSNPNVHQ